MTAELASTPTLSPQETALLTGDMSNLSPQDRQQLILNICRSLGLNPWTGPLRMLFLDKRWTVYVTKDGADQLARIHGASCVVLSERVEDDMYIVNAQARMGDRVMDNVGIVAYVNIGGDWKTAESGKKYFEEDPTRNTPLTLNQKINARMKGYTKATRRALLSICGLGLLVEDERDTIASSITVDEDPLEQHPRRVAAKSASAVPAQPVPLRPRAVEEANRRAVEEAAAPQEPPAPQVSWGACFLAVQKGVDAAFTAAGQVPYEPEEAITTAAVATTELGKMLEDLTLALAAGDPAATAAPMTAEQRTALGSAATWYRRRGLELPMLTLPQHATAVWLDILRQARQEVQGHG